MKHASILACVLAASAMPAAIAQTPEAATSNAKAYEIRVTGDVVPADLNKLTYPYMAAKRGDAGACDLSVQTDDAGNIGVVMVRNCSSDGFRKEASKLADAGGNGFSAAADHTVRIEWTID